MTPWVETSISHLWTENWGDNSIKILENSLIYTTSDTLSVLYTYFLFFLFSYSAFTAESQRRVKLRPELQWFQPNQLLPNQNGSSPPSLSVMRHKVSILFVKRTHRLTKSKIYRLFTSITFLTFLQHGRHSRCFYCFQ